MITDADTCGAAESVAAMPKALEDANLSRRWWQKQSTFCLFTMQDASMRYHLDLWATAVLYVVLWGVKLFVVAPPTERNLKLLREWQAPLRATRAPPDNGDPHSRLPLPQTTLAPHAPRRCRRR